jgi:preprotein translocase subunit SecE
MAKATTAGTSDKDGKSAKVQKGSKSVKADKPNVFARIAQYFRDVRAEMKRVVWPGRQEVLNSSVVVVVTLIFFVAFTFIVDSGVYQVLRLIREIGN